MWELRTPVLAGTMISNFLDNRSMFPRIVGAKGANVARLRAESQADITVSREDNTIVIVGKSCFLFLLLISAF